MPVILLLLMLGAAFQSVDTLRSDIERPVALARAASIAEAMGGQHTAALAYISATLPLECDQDTGWRMKPSDFVPRELERGSLTHEIVSLCNRKGVLTILPGDDADPRTAAAIFDRLMSLLDDDGLTGRLREPDRRVMTQDGVVHDDFFDAIAELPRAMPGSPFILTSWE